MTTIHIVPHQHFDVIWRRPVDWYVERRAELYTQALFMLEKYPHFTFTFSQAATLRQFLEHEPSRTERFKALLSEGRMEIIGGVETIIDLNLSTGTSILRCIEDGRRWFAKTLNYDVRIGAFEDAFGISAQIPQILHLCDYSFFKSNRMPRPGKDDISGDFLWRGLDGTTIRCVSPDANHVEWGWGYPDNPDDLTTPSLERRIEKVRSKLIQAPNMDSEHILFVVMGEEHDILEETVVIVDELNRATTKDVIFKFSTFMNYYRHLDDSYWRHVPVYDTNTDVSRIFTGCYTTRIDSKQLPRRLEHILIGRAFGGMALDEAAEIRHWRTLHIAQFHDAIGGCHIDENADFLTSICEKSIESLIDEPIKLPWNPFIPSFPDKPCEGSVSANDALEYGCFQISTNNREELSVKYKGTRFDRFIDIIAREEHGTLWTEEYGDREIVISQSERLIASESTDSYCRLKLSGESPATTELWPGFSRLTYEKTLTFFRESDMVLVELDLELLGNSAEIAIRWPISDVEECLAEIPFGSIKRTVYEPTTICGRAFPVLNWVRTNTFAIVNQGVPSHVIRDGFLETVLSRSPVKRWSPWFPVTPTESCWNNGKHQFRFLLIPVSPSVSNGQLHHVGMEFNMPKSNPEPLEWIHSMPDNLVVMDRRRINGKQERWLIFEADGRETTWRINSSIEETIFKPKEIKWVEI